MHEMFERWENPEAGATVGGEDRGSALGHEGRGEEILIKPKSWRTVKGWGFPVSILGPVGSTGLLVEMPHLSSSYRREPDGRVPVESASAPRLSLSLDPTQREMWLFFSLSTHMPP